MTRPIYIEALPARRPTLDDLRRRVDVVQAREARMQAAAVGCSECREWFPLLRCACGRLLCRGCAEVCCHD